MEGEAMPLARLLLQAPGGHMTVQGLLLQAGPFGKAVLLLLIGLSVWSWAIIFDRSMRYRRVRSADRAFLGAFRRTPAGGRFELVADHHPHSMLAQVARAGQRALEVQPVDPARPLIRIELAQRAMERAASEEETQLERGVAILATVGSVSPFIGLMGTVWGVMTAFLNIGAQGSAALAVVAPGIAEALITTVAGIGAAVPAVAAYNHLLGRLREFGNGAGSFTSEFLEREMGARRS
jgi:biopolymer transport protein TolQ